MSDSVQIKVFFGIILLAFFGGLYYRDNLSPDAKDEVMQEDVNEAWEHCRKQNGESEFNSICAAIYLKSYKGYSIEELQKFKIRQEKKIK